MRKWKTFLVPLVAAPYLLFLFGCCPPFCRPSPEPKPESKYRLSPPTVNAPLYECATAVTVAGFVPGAKIDIYANGVSLIGSGVSDAPWGQSFPVTPPLSAGQVITATQSVGGDTSAPSKGVTVVDYFALHPEGLRKPVLDTPIHDCGGAIGVRNLVEGGLLEVFADAHSVGSASGCGAGQWLFVNPLFAKGQKIDATETLCAKVSPRADAQSVIDAPSTLPAPVVEDIYEGGKYCTVGNIANNAMVKVYDGSHQIAGHYCSGGRQIFRMNPQPAAGDSVTAVQLLCLVTSDPSDPTIVKPCSELPAPKVKPICTGDDFIIVSGTVVDARIKIYANGSLVGDGGGTKINLTRTLMGGEVITATQSLGSCTSPASFAVAVGSGSVRQGELLTMKNGNTFFEAESGETPIRGLVYTRGTGCAPYFAVKAGSLQGAVVHIEDSKGRKAATIQLAQHGGYWDGAWNWASPLWQNIPDEIPVGEYKATLKMTLSTGTVSSETMVFYVIFSPSEVTAPEEFALSDKGEVGIWFYPPGSGKSRATVYYLHPDDERIFGQAIKLVNGQTSAYDSSKLLMDWVVPQQSSYCSGGPLPATATKRFVYSICTSENDVLDLLARTDRLAQCADCANMFVALLRAVGIPSHPATGDAAAEHGAISWGFDTWSEARVRGPLGEQWYVYHPHDPPLGYGPVSQLDFGTNHPWANKRVNDLVIMAEPTWNATEVADAADDVTFGYNTACQEPDQSFTHVKGWLKHLCLASGWGMGYWGKGHWTCSPPKSRGVDIRLDRDAYTVGEEIRLTVTVRNVTDNEIRSVAEISVADDDPWTKQWPDRDLFHATEKITLKPGQEETFAKSFRLPLALSADHNHMIVVKIPGVAAFFTVKDFSVSPLFTWKLSLPRQAKLDEPFAAVLELTNGSGTDIQGLRMGARLPRHVEGRLVEKVPRSIPAGGRVSARWDLRAVSPSAATQLMFTVETENGGSIKIVEGIDVR